MVSGYACPFEPMDDAFNSLIVGEYGRGYLQIFLKRHSEAIGTERAELDSVFTSGITFDMAWGLGFGGIRRALQLAVCPSAAAATLTRELRGERPSLLECLMNERRLGVLSGSAASMGIHPTGRLTTLALVRRPDAISLRRGDRIVVETCAGLPDLGGPNGSLHSAARWIGRTNAQRNQHGLAWRG